MNKISSLYQVKKYCWLLFRNKQAALYEGSIVETAIGINDSVELLYWNKQYNGNVSYISPKDILVLLELDGKFKKVLTSNGEMGWTWFIESYNNCFEEVSQ